MGLSPAPPRPPVESSLLRWERGFDVVVAWAPYVTLAIGTLLAVVSGDDLPDRAVSLGLGSTALAWTYLLFTRRDEPEDHQGPTRLYFAGFLALAAGMMAHQPPFFVYVITGFIHAFLLRPAPLAFLGVGLTSLIINSRIIFPNPTSDNLWTYGIIVVIQTVAVGFGITGGEKIGELSEQRRRALIDLQKALEENAGLHSQLVAQAREAGINDERQRMAREIHDTIAQGLTGIITQLEAATRVVDDPGELRRRLDNANRLARQSLAEARRSVRAVLPVSLSERHLPEALADVVSQWTDLTGVPAELTTTGTPEPLHPEVEVALLRVVQEALTNTAKHAAATRVGVTLSYMDDVVSVDVKDDGVGLSTSNGSGESDGSGFGLAAMRQRVEALSGHLEIESAPGAGTAISATVPAIRVEVEGG